MNPSLSLSPLCLCTYDTYKYAAYPRKHSLFCTQMHEFSITNSISLPKLCVLCIVYIPAHLDCRCTKETYVDTRTRTYIIVTETAGTALLCKPLNCLASIRKTLLLLVEYTWFCWLYEVVQPFHCTSVRYIWQDTRTIHTDSI